MLTTHLNHSTAHPWLIRLAAASAFVAAMFAAGCTTTQSQDKKAAFDRWSSARAAITYGVATQQFDVGDLEKAQRSCEQAISADPKNPRFYVLAGRIYAEQGKLEMAYRMYQQSIELDGKQTDAFYQTGVVLQRWQQYDKAYDAYMTAYKNRSDDAAPLLAAAEMQVQLGHDDQAVAMLADKLVYFEHNAAIRMTIGRVYLLNHRIPEAIKMLRDAWLLAPEDPIMLEQLAMAEYAGEQWTDAIFHLQRLLEMPTAKDRRDLRMALGDCLQMSGKNIDARLIFLKLSQDDPTDVNAWIKLGQAAWMVGDEGKLRESARQTLTLAPDRYEGHLLQGLVERRLGNTFAAVAQFDTAAKLAPQQAQPWIMRGLTLQDAGNKAEAAAAYQQALKVNPNDMRAKELLAGVSTE